MSDSILTSVKKTLGLEESDESFDLDITLFINSVLSTLNQIGVGPEAGFQIEDKTTTWESFLGTDPRLNNVKAYVYLKVRLMFDPPSTSFAIEAMKKNAEELEFRINMTREVDRWQTQQALLLSPFQL